jgi:type IV secretory pathway VirB4 component
METLHSKKLSKQTTTSATQKFLGVAEVKEDVIILKNGALRGVLAVSAINYDLKSSDEQEAIISQYQNFLNSLDFPLQIIINSRKLNIAHYLEFIGGKEKEQPNELLRLQISEYKNFIDQLVSVSNIMEKNFYIIVPFSPIESSEKSFFSNLFAMGNPKKNIAEKKENFETYKNQLFQRMDQITAGLSGIGLRLAPLQTQELIELLYNAYNPNVFALTELGEIKNLDLK